MTARIQWLIDLLRGVFNTRGEDRAKSDSRDAITCFDIRRRRWRGEWIFSAKCADPAAAARWVAAVVGWDVGVNVTRVTTLDGVASIMIVGEGAGPRGLGFDDRPPIVHGR